MAHTHLTADIIAKEATMILENNLVMTKLVYRGYENEFEGRSNGYKKGDTITIRKPADFTVRTGAVMAAQDSQEGTTTIVVDQRKGVDFKFTSQDLTLKIGDLSERLIKPAMIQLANGIDFDLLTLYQDVWNWVGTPGEVVNSFSDFSKGPARLDAMATPVDDQRAAVLSSADHWGLLGSQTALYIQDAAKQAYRKGTLGELGGVDTYMDQNINTHVAGTRDDTTPLTRGTSNTTTYALSKDSGTMSLSTDGWDTVATIKKGDVFTIADVYAVNPVSKATLPFLQQFVVTANVTAHATTSSETLVTISPPIITSGAHQTVNSAPGDDKAIVNVGTASTGYPQNLVFHKNAFALVMVPLISPPGAVDVSRQSYKGVSVRVIPVYDGINDESAWRLDVLYGKKTLDARLATRLSGTA